MDVTAVLLEHVKQLGELLVLNQSERAARSEALLHTGVGIHILAVYPDSEFVLVHRVQTQQPFEFEQSDLYRVIGVWGV